VTDSQDILTFYADEKDQATITCPKCSFIRTISALPYKDVKRALKVGCKCGNKFLCRIEYRKYFRKKVNLAGEYGNPKTGEHGDMLVADLSMKGIGFPPVQPHQLKPEDTVIVTFKLDDRNKSEVKRKTTVRAVKGSFIGAEFVEGQPINRELNFYLMR
jgi:hypothetical protein